MEDNRVGLVLGAGGTSGGFFIRAAMAAITERTGWEPAMCQTIVGTSAGALNAARTPPQRGVLAKATLSNLTALASELSAPAPSFADRLLSGPREAGGRLVGRFAPSGKNDPGYPVATGPFHPGVSVVSCKRSNGTRRVALLQNSADPTAELYASAAVPGFATPVIIDGDEYVDGAVFSTTNADLVTVDQHDLLIVVAPMAPHSGGSLVQRAHRAAVLTEMRPWRQAHKPVVFIAPSAEAVANKDDHEGFGADATIQILTG